MRANIQLFNEDCLPAMQKMKDKEFDLAIVDPPYGIKIMKQWGNADNDYRQFKVKEWDNKIPDEIYFKELMRVSKNQIIWGGNYFTNHLYPSQGWVIYDKGQEGFTLADAELGWTSFDRAIRRKKIHRSNKNNPDRIHIAQKPLILYKWLLENYAEKGHRILDTHLGSGSIALACWDFGFDLVGYEIDKEYFDGAMKRLKLHESQLQLY